MIDDALLVADSKMQKTVQILKNQIIYAHSYLRI